jgi:peptidoglycan/LPS O-acetylase OafA/YrhL|tara:strand:- start:940 stop:1983 length:1044 start_codon:yes stop_codon:yes gene_type:complete
MKKFYFLELLRFFSSISVLLFHYRHFFYPYNTFSQNEYSLIKNELPFNNLLEVFFDFGIYGVHVFYAISGFVFAHVYLLSKEKSSFKDFFINRFARLYPLHFATLILVTFLQFVNLVNFDTFQVIQFNDLYHFFLQIFFISAWGLENGHSFNGPIWSVSIEIAIYLFFFIILTHLRKWKIYLTMSICLIFLLINKITIYESLFIECIRLFFSGVLIYLLCDFKKFNNYLIFTSILLIILSLIGNFKTYIFCPSIVLLFVSLDNISQKIKFRERFQIFGNLTYALYLLHFPFQLIIIFIVKYLNISFSIMINPYSFFLYFLSLFIIAHYCFKLYEKPLNKKIRLMYKN